MIHSVFRTGMFVMYHIHFCIFSLGLRPEEIEDYLLWTCGVQCELIFLEFVSGSSVHFSDLEVHIRLLWSVWINFRPSSSSLTQKLIFLQLQRFLHHSTCPWAFSSLMNILSNWEIETDFYTDPVVPSTKFIFLYYVLMRTVDLVF